MMKLFSLFKKTEKTGADTSVGSEELFENVQKTNSTDDIETELSFHPDWNITQEQEYVFRYFSTELEPLKPNQISLSGIDIDVNEYNGEWLVKAFLRTSLDQPIQMGEVELLLMNEKDDVLASKQFDLSELGELPPRSDRPWVFIFSESNLSTEEEPPKENWKLAFNVQSLIPHRLDLAPAWEQSLSEEQKEALAKIVENLPKLGPTEVNLTGFQLKEQEDGSVAASIFLRNGHSKQINIENLPLELLDASGDRVALGSFKLEDLSVKANTTKPWTFIYPKEMIVKEKPDFSRWTARIPQQ